ncbi:MAG: anaerobic ribonucleoside-triphosphate reductase activating protein [Candidatus Aquicultorales bacterium]
MSDSGAVVSGSLGVVGTIPSSMLDWEGKVVSVLFTAGCNFRCPFCHNAELVVEPEKLPGIPWKTIRSHLEKKAGWIDGVCVTGGEPTLNPHLETLAEEIKALNLALKLDTNGTRPEILDDLLTKDLLDYVALDIKTAFAKYQLVGAGADVEDTVRRSVTMLIEAERRGQIQAEFRTTSVPGFADPEDIRDIAEFLGQAGAGRYTIQRYNPENVLDKEASPETTYPKERLVELAGECSEFVPTAAR